MIKLGVLPVRSLLVTEEALWAASGGQVFVIGVETLGVQVSGWASERAEQALPGPGPGTLGAAIIRALPLAHSRRAATPVANGSSFQTWLRETAWLCGRRVAVRVWRGVLQTPRRHCADAVPSEQGSRRERGGAGVSLPSSLWLWPRHVLLSVLEGDTHLACPSGTVHYCDAP